MIDQGRTIADVEYAAKEMLFRHCWPFGFTPSGGRVTSNSLRTSPRKRRDEMIEGATGRLVAGGVMAS